MVSSLTFIEEAIVVGNCMRLMVASQQENLLREFNFETVEKTDGLNSEFSSIYIVTQKEVSSLWRHSSIGKNSQKIIVLSMNIPTDINGCFQLQ